jgi:3-oxoacyl-[acyl-carrier-protein] synthase-3
MSTPEVKEIRVITNGLAGASYFPPNKVDNETFAKQLNELRSKDDQKKLITAQGIFERTGIEIRHLIDPLDQIPSPSIVVEKREAVIMEMAQRVAKEALARKGWSPKDVEAVIFSTSVPFGRSPSKLLKSQMNLGPWIKNFDGDVIAECASLVWAFEYILGQKEQYQGKNILYVTSEWISCLGAPDDLDRTLLSDGTSAIAFCYGKDLEIISTRTKEFEEFAHLIRGPIQKELTEQEAIIKFVGIPPSDDPDGYETMDGRGVFVWSLSPETLPPLICDVKDALGEEKPKIIIPHQANGRITQEIKKRRLPELDLTDVHLYDNIARFGNCGSVTIPNALLEVMEEGWIEDGQKKFLQKNDIVMLIGFGAGMSAGVSAIRILK